MFRETGLSLFWFGITDCQFIYRFPLYCRLLLLSWSPSLQFIQLLSLWHPTSVAIQLHDKWKLKMAHSYSVVFVYSVF